jgi:ATP-binding cassette subfamily B protein
MNIYRRFYSYLKPHLGQLAIVIIALLVTSSSILSFGLVLRHVIDTSAGGYFSISSFIPILGIIFIFATASFIRAYSIYAICEKIICKIRQDAYIHLNYISPFHFEIQKTSDIISRLTNDSLVVATAISDTFSFALRNGLTAIGCAVLMLYVSPQLGLYILAIIPVLVPLIVFAGKKVRKTSKQNQEAISTLSSDIEETFNAIKTIQSFNIQEQKISHFINLSNNVLHSNLARLVVSSSLVSSIIFLILSGILIVIILGLNEVAQGNLSAGDLSSFLFYSLMGATSLAGIANIVSDFQRSIAAAERLFGLFDLGEENQPMTPKDKILDSYYVNKKIAHDDIIFKNVNFYYPARPEEKILDNISFQIKNGEFIGIVGKSGCGKTTIISLLEKFYNSYDGSISLGEKNIKDIPNLELRNIMALVPQDPFIFSASAKDNILIGNMKATDEEVFEAAKKAGIYDFLIKLPQAFDTYVGEKGVMLSGGQRQRIAIARAFLKKPQILLLDEATSALDATHEEDVHKAIKSQNDGMTVIAIAHRILTIKDADRIFVMEKGKITAVGTHEELLEQSKLYRDLAYNM